MRVAGSTDNDFGKPQTQLLEHWTRALVWLDQIAIEIPAQVVLCSHFAVCYIDVGDCSVRVGNGKIMRSVIVLLVLPSSHNRTRCTPYGWGTEVVEKLLSSSVGDYDEQLPGPSACSPPASVTVIELR